MVRWLLPVMAVWLTACHPSAKEGAQEVVAEDTELQLKEALHTQINDTSRQLTQQAFQALSSVLMAQIKSNGAAAAVGFCNLNALPITDSLAKQHGVQIKRLASRNRNPLNAANAQESEWLTGWEKSLQAGETLAPKTEVLGDSIHWFGAIVLNQPACLQCHGAPNTDIAAATLAKLNELYPNDQAQNFKLGELRGMWKISYPKAFFQP